MNTRPLPEGPVPVLLVGLHGHGRSHLRALRPLADQGLVRLVGVCDPRPPTPGDDLEGHGPVPHFDDLDRALRETEARVTVLVTPIHTHLPLARTVLAHGSHLLLEKPTTATLAELHELTDAVAASGLACQVGFQSLGSAGIDHVRHLLAEGAVGELRGIGGAGTWKRTSAYYDRAPWAGRRRMAGHDVVDGALTNPFAHMVATSLALADGGSHAPREITPDLFHAHPIEADDTSCLRLRTHEDIPVCLAVTLCAPRSLPPALHLHGERGHITFEYTVDRITVHRPGHAPLTTTHPRTGLMENLIAHLREDVPLLVPPTATLGFTHVLEAVRTAPDPRPIPTEYQDVWREAGATHRTVHDIEALVRLSARRMTTFADLGAAWAASIPTAHPLEVRS
ncbi:Gfo/Idh/MocA family protein [Nocardiopsis sp. MG754419]|uniref:Gfo/Idh/MocA family protein n=1 Tax=Nocardiopsis sp. MG754419 TaxID=2259865 RepID=UPI001BA5758F|nr:Gfo/Idh/MocA family oxidoreductase [Nocardiopsis sp. MG754419]MBR8743296.1 gfo/Idh/MocA family oxidoreductase [Nocardiopsis sp. MG754419]